MVSWHHLALRDKTDSGSECVGEGWTLFARELCVLLSGE